MEQQRATGRAERQVAEFIKNDQVDLCEHFSHLPGLPKGLFLLQCVDQFDGRVKAHLASVMFDGLDAADPLLITKLTWELDAITSRALDALGRLIDRHGNFTEPPICTAAKDTWRSDNNHIMQYLAERVYKAPSASVSVQAMYDDYRNWFASTCLRGQLGRKQFANRVEAADIAKSSRRSQGYFFMNVNLR